MQQLNKEAKDLQAQASRPNLLLGVTRNMQTSWFPSEISSEGVLSADLR